MSADEFLTIAGPGHAQTRVLGSRFLGSALPVAGEDEVSAHLEAERKHYHDATHWCYAFRLGTSSVEIEKAADAGEPHGTAGQPILREIRKRDLTQCLVIITRYFGGTKLGTGGLARAYGECAALCLDACAVVRHRILASCRVECPYEIQNSVYTIAHRFNATVEAMPASDRAMFLITLSPDAMPLLLTALRDATSGRIKVEEVAR